MPKAAIRGFGGVTGHGLEAQFPLGLALAALTLESGARVPTFDANAEKPMGEAATEAVVTTKHLDNARREELLCEFHDLDPAVLCKRGWFEDYDIAGHHGWG